MLLGVLIGGKSYSPQKYLFVLLIVAGVAAFIFKDKYDANDGKDPLIGGLLIALSLLMDGLVGATQERLRAFSKPSWDRFMLNVNYWGVTILIPILAVTGEGRDMIDFAFMHPTVIWHLALAVLVGTSGQVFITMTISSFGSLPVSLITTTRKFFTVLMSVLLFENKLTTRQWIAAAVIFTALLLDACFSKKVVAPTQEKVVYVKEDKSENSQDPTDVQSEVEEIFIDDADVSVSFMQETSTFDPEQKV